MKQNGSIKIESGIQIPIASNKRNAYPFKQLRVGQSFFVKGGKITSLSSYASHARAALPNTRFTMRTMDGGVRVWRIA